MNLIESTGLIVIVRGSEADKLISLAESLSEGGVRLMEITYDMSGKTDDSTIAAEIEALSKRFGGAVARRDLMDAGDYAALSKNAAAFTDVIRKAKGLC